MPADGATREALTHRLTSASTCLSALHRSLPAAYAAKAEVYATAYYDQVSEGYSVTAAREYAALQAREHTASYERIKGDIDALAEEVSLLRFLIEHDLPCEVLP